MCVILLLDFFDCGVEAFEMARRDEEKREKISILVGDDR